MMSSGLCGKATAVVARSTKVSKLGLSTSASSSAAGSSERDRRQTMDLKGAADLAAIKKGPGYRSSFSGLVATVFGSTGCIGRAVCNRLGKNGSQMIIPYRGDHYRYMRLKVCGDLGQVLFTPYHLKDEESIRRSMHYSNVVINLIDRDYPTRNFSLEDVLVTGPARLARIARECGVERFVHISNINAREKPKSVFLPGGSDYLRLKWEGENAVLEEFPDATIFRPTDVYGPTDAFINHYMSWGRRGFRRRMPLWKKGDETIKAPLYFTDMASGIMNSLDDPAAKGQIYEAYGPHKYLLSELIDWMNLKSNRDPYDWGYRRTDLRISPTVFLKALVYQNLPMGQKYFGKHSIDKLERTSLSDEILGLPNLEDLHVKASSVPEKMPFELVVWHAFGSYIPENIEDDPVVPDPIPLTRMEAREVLHRGDTGVMKMLGLN